MITKADIKQETNSVSYNRGKKIYEEQKVHAFQVQEMKDIFGYQLHKITAVVDSQKFAGNHIMLRRIQINLKFHLRRKILL